MGGVLLLLLHPPPILAFLQKPSNQRSLPTTASPQSHTYEKEHASCGRNYCWLRRSSEFSLSGRHARSSVLQGCTKQRVAASSGV